MALSLHQTAFVDLGPLTVTGYPFTMVGWFRVPSVASFLTLMRIDNTVTTSFHTLVYEGNSAGQAAAVSKVSDTAAARSTIAMTPNQWHHVAGVFEAHNLRRVYLDGGNMGSGTHSRVFDGANQFRVGNIGSASGVDTAEVAILDAVLGADEIAMLARGCSVLSLPKVGNLLSYHDFVRGVNRPGIGPLAEANSPAVVDHPRVLMAGGGRTLAQPSRTCGPFRIEVESLRTSFAEPAQLSIAGIAAGAGQASVAGMAAENSVLCGEVLQ